MARHRVDLQRLFEERFPHRARCWRLRSRVLDLPPRPLLMGIINVTPDSFSDGGRYLDADAAVAHGLRLVAEGADLLDVGGESTRPGSQPVPVEEELRRVLPVIMRLAQEADVPISVDTSKAAVARAAVGVGAEIINDVTGLEGDATMARLAVEAGVGVCAMHMQGTPRSMQENPRYKDVVVEVHQYLRDRRDGLEAAGMARDRICLDPGIGFGKNLGHNLSLLGSCARFHDLGCPIMVGHSRKRFLAKLLDDVHDGRLPGTIGVALSLAAQGVQILRVHDIRPVREAIVAFQATSGIDRAGRES